MMSIGMVKSSMNVHKYFIDQDNYYLTDKSEIKEAAQWYGKGAAILNLLNDGVDEQPFLALLKGEMPDGQQIGLMRDNSIRHRPATDLTFSAPKSVSVLALIQGDRRLVQAHNNAVKKTLDVVESLYAEARKTVDRDTRYEKTGNLLMSLFHHTTSRELDAQLHTHSVIINATRRDDEQWRALSSRQKNDVAHIDHGFRENVLANQHYLGMIYTSTLAKAVVECGYQITVVDRHGNFKINGLDDAYLQSQSKRRDQVLAQMDKLGLSGAKAANMAALSSRQSKQSVDMASLREYWLADAMHQGVDLDVIYDQSLTPTHEKAIETTLVVLSQHARQAVKDAVDHLSEYAVKLSHSDIIRQAFIFSGGLLEHEALEQAIAERHAMGQLIGQSQRYYTTRELIDKEKTLKTHFRQSTGVSYQRHLKQSGVPAHVFNHADRVQVVDVNGLKNETRLLNDFVRLSEANNLVVTILQPTNSHINRLSGDVKRESGSLWERVRNWFKPSLMQTVSHFKTLQHRQQKRDGVIVVADAQKLSYVDAKELDDIAQQRGAKLVMLNNTNSSLGWRPGNTMRLLKESGVAQHRSSSQTLDCVVELKEAKQPIHALAQHWVEQTDRPQLVATTTTAQSDLTRAVRHALQIKQALSVYHRPFVTQSTRGLSDVQKRKASFYREGDFVTLNPFTSKQWNGVVALVDRDNAQLTLMNQRGETKQLDLHSSGEWDVKKQQSLSIADGDTLRTTRKVFVDRHTVIEKNTVLSVLSFNEEGIRVNDGNRSLWLSRDKLATSFIDYGYVIKPHQLTHQQNVMTALSGYQLNKRQLGDIKEFAQHIAVFTDDASKASRLLEQTRTAWLASDLSEPDHARAMPIIRTDHTIQHDLEVVVNALCGDEKEKAHTAVSYALALLGEREAAFKMADVLKSAMEFALGDISHDEIKAVIDQKMATGELLIPNDHYLTTEKAYALETDILAINQQGKNSVQPVYAVAPVLSERLTAGQRDAVSLALTTSDRFIAIQGLAGTGKTTMMKELLAQATVKGFSLVGIAPTHKAVEKLAESLSEIKTHNTLRVMTAHKFLGEEVGQFNDKTIFIADEASMLSNLLFHDVQKKVIDCQGREIYLGDINQQVSIESGKPLELSIYHGVRTATMDEIVRQTEKSELKPVVELAAQREAAPSLKQLQSIDPQAVIERGESQDLPDEVSLYRQANTSFIEVGIDKDEKNEAIFHDGVPSLNNLYQHIANDYLTRISEQRDQTLVVANMHESRDAIETIIREGLKKEGIINNTVLVSRLVSRNLDQAQLLHARHYKTGDILVFNQSYSIGKRGEHMAVIKIDSERNTLTLKDHNQQCYTINPAAIALKANITVHTLKETDLGIGDRLRLRKTDKTLGWVGGQEYTVSSIHEGIASLSNADDKIMLQLDQLKEQHWDFAYTNTTYSVQGDTAPYVIGVEVNDNFRSNYIQVSRASQHTTIYTADKAWLLRHLSDNAKMDAANKKSAIEVMSRLKNNKKSKSKPTPIKDVQPHRVSAKEIQPLLEQRFKELVVQLLGKPNAKLSSQHQWRFGHKGSVSVDLNKGRWHSFETGEGGNALSLIQHELGLRDFKAVVEYAADFLNYRPGDAKQLLHNKRTNRNKPSTSTIANADNEKQAKMKHYAQSLVARSQAIAGTLGEVYLKEHRELVHIEQPDIRYLPAITGYQGQQKVQTPAVLAIARDQNKEVHHVQVIRLDSRGQKNKTVSIAKQTYGAMKGHAVELNQKTKPAVSYLAEGVETGLSIVTANQKAHVLAVLGKSNFLHINLKQLADKVILCLDNDGYQTWTDNVIMKAVQRLEENGKDVSLIIPELAKQDLNDVLTQEGKDAVKQQVDRLITPNEFKAVGKFIGSLGEGDHYTVSNLLAQSQQSVDKHQQILLPIEQHDTKEQHPDLKKHVLNDQAKQHEVSKLAGSLKQSADVAASTDRQKLHQQSAQVKRALVKDLQTGAQTEQNLKSLIQSDKEKQHRQQVLLKEQVDNITPSIKQRKQSFDREYGQ